MAKALVLLPLCLLKLRFDPWAGSVLMPWVWPKQTTGKKKKKRDTVRLGGGDLHENPQLQLKMDNIMFRKGSLLKHECMVVVPWSRFLC